MFGHEARAAAASRSRALSTLDPHQNATVVSLADVIIPETDTPGATAAAVNEFVDLILTEWFDDPQTTAFLDGLAELDRRCNGLHGADFIALSPEVMIAEVARLDGEIEEARSAGESVGGRFFHQMKRLTIAGFFTSEIGQQLTGGDEIPGRLEGCTLLPGYR